MAQKSNEIVQNQYFEIYIDPTKRLIRLEHGTLDVLILNAGVSPARSIGYEGYWDLLRGLLRAQLWF